MKLAIKFYKTKAKPLHDSHTLKVYHLNNPECHKYYTEFQCWALDFTNDTSINNCAEKMGYSKKQIEYMKKIHKQAPDGENNV